jgi:hypothetical protein
MEVLKRQFKTKKNAVRFFLENNFRHNEEIVKIVQKGNDFFIALKVYRGEVTALREVVTVFHLKVLEKNGLFKLGLMKAENVGIPNEDCPKTILTLLTESESRIARDWRAKCWKKFGVVV